MKALHRSMGLLHLRPQQKVYLYPGCWIGEILSATDGVQPVGGSRPMDRWYKATSECSRSVLHHHIDLNFGSWIIHESWAAPHTYSQWSLPDEFRPFLGNLSPRMRERQAFLIHYRRCLALHGASNLAPGCIQSDRCTHTSVINVVVLVFLCASILPPVVRMQKSGSVTILTGLMQGIKSASSVCKKSYFLLASSPCSNYALRGSLSISGRLLLSLI